MKRLFPAAIAVGLLVAAWAFSGVQRVSQELDLEVEKANPWTHLRVNNAPETFHFAVVSDRTGGHRARVFSQAVHQLNLLQPSFVVSVGDLIEGYTRDRARLTEEWKEFQSYVHKLQMPFFYVPGNHDLANSVQVDEWKERLGRRYYHFVYRGVLFLAVATDDEGEDGKTYGAISPAQVEYFKKVLAENSNVRWTLLFLHKPVWSLPNAKTEGWVAIEKALEGRKYTVFAGHVHRYQKFVRNGMNYYQLATTGGGSKMRGVDYREFDHIAWVTMKNDGPVIANIMLDGILPDDLKSVVSAEEGVAIYNRKPTQPVTGKVTYDGSPIPGAKLFFHLVDAATNRSSVVADAFVEADGSYRPSSYKAFDGLPAGDYVVTVTWRDPYFDDVGNPGPNRLPEKFASIQQSELKATVKVGPNQVDFNLVP